jgi:hypothetical protein
MKMYLIFSVFGWLVTVGEVWVTMKDIYQTTMKAGGAVLNSARELVGV